MTHRALGIFVTLAVAVLPACGWPLGLRPGVPLFGDFTAAGPNVMPPQRGLELWLEAGELRADGSGRVARWPDRRGVGEVHASTLLDAGMMAGTIATSTLRTPEARARPVPALRCTASPRCSYAFADRTGTIRRNVLTGQPYALLAVVRRAGGRGDNYVLMTDGTGCRPLAGGTSCDANTALHFGWSGEGTLRLGQYDNDVTFDVPRFNAAAPALSLLVGRSDSRGKLVGMLELLRNGRNTAPDARPLERSGTLFLGGTPWGDGNAVPDWRFEGDIFAVLVYTVELSDDELRQAGDYLRTHYGPA
jgi:hypothetical protein